IQKPKKDIIGKKATANASISTLTNNGSTNLTTPATTINSTLLYKGRIFIGLTNLGGSSIDFC
ncbi:hypothetical protein OFC47_25680, partial [Escherichia coli]|nr:hypothetical protein [Escherichia coli]